MIELEIDGKTVVVAEGSTVIEAADQMDIYIPRFCYHKKLSIAANCRMCLVDVEKVGKPLPACATPVTPGMKVFTRTDKALRAQRAVMEFLLINHPLDCPICDQGGECELQDLSLGFGRGYSNYDESKRAVFSDNIGPLIETEMTRCIHCTRCVRFGEEVAGLRELGAVGRGENMEIGTYVKHFMRSEVSGNIIDLCPVGALTNKPARYQGRAWEYREHPAISPHDCLGAHLFLHTRKFDTPVRKVMRAVPRENETINETWMSDRDRYSCHGLYHPSRVEKPRMKIEGQWIETTWEEALNQLTVNLQKILHEDGSDQIAGLASPSSTLEELYLFQKLLRGLGSPHIDHRVRWQDFSDQMEQPLFPSLGMNIVDIDKLKTVLLVGCHLRQEQPLLNYRFINLTNDNGKVFVINAADYPFTFPITTKCIVSFAEMLALLAEIAEGLRRETASLSEPAKIIAAHLKEDNAAIILGAQALQHPEAAKIRSLVASIAKLTQAKVGCLTEGANSAGAWLAGTIPHRGLGGEPISQPGLESRSLLTTQIKKAYFLLNLEAELDTAYPASALQTLQQAKTVICLTPFVNAAMENYADFILPITPYAETSGTYVNIEGKWQSFTQASTPHYESKPGWKVLRVLANFLSLPDFNYKTTIEIRDELKQKIEAAPPIINPLLEEKALPLPISELTSKLMRLTEWPLYSVDALVRRSKPLQETAQYVMGKISIGISPHTANQLQVKEGDWVIARQKESEITLPISIHPSLSDKVIIIPAGIPETAGFGEAQAEVQLTRRVPC